ncbi:hypothetical protein F4779DRAFT_614801 [Xylariaceae sp. FL0662B]|nr:hypothetical protein F4779DRAFT_614801 [Xylariaceae sp. FL0662B]
MAFKLLSELISLYLLIWGTWGLAPGHWSLNTRNGIPSPRGRRLAFGTIARDIKHRQAKDNFNTRRDVADPDPETLIAKLWRENEDLVGQFLNVEFLRFQADNPQNETLPSYQYYSVQDYYYLVDYVQFKALRMTTTAEFSATQLLATLDAETASVQGSVDDAWGFRNGTLARDLAVPLDAVDGGRRAGPELAYADWLQKNLDLGWFALHVMTIPCIYGWGRLAAKLESSNTTRRDTVFYRTWVQANNDPSYGQNLSDFLESYRADYESADAKRTWTAVFRQALQFEIDLFDSALGKNLTSI